MKKPNSLTQTLSFLLMVVLLWSCSGNQEMKPAVKTEVGMFTPYFYFPEQLNGKVQSLKEVNYWAVAENGEVTAGDRISLSDRDSLINWTNDMEIFFDENGLLTKTILLDENDKPFGHWMVESMDGKINKSSWITNDSVSNYVLLSYPQENMFLMERFDGQTDTIINQAEVKLNDHGQKVAIQFFNSAGEPRALAQFNYDMTGQLTSYTVTRDDTLRIKMSFETNDHGFFQKQDVYVAADGTTESNRYEYTYDDMGNWIRYVSYNDDEPEVVCERTYAYYAE